MKQVQVLKGCILVDGGYVKKGEFCDLSDHDAIAFAKRGVVELVDEDMEDTDGTPLGSLEGMTAAMEAVLKEAGYDFVEEVAQASEADLIALKGIGEATAQRLLDEADKLLG